MTRTSLIGKSLTAFATGLLITAPAAADSYWHVDSREDLEYGSVLFEYYQDEAFTGLIEQAYAEAIGNSRAMSDRAQLVKGSLALSYGMPDTAFALFDQLLASDASQPNRNRAWYQLARLYQQQSQTDKADQALDEISGELPEDLHLDYHYLRTLVSRNSEDLRQVEAALQSISPSSAQYPYLLFNLAVNQLVSGNTAAASRNLQRVLTLDDGSEERGVLADRARHGLAQIATQEDRLDQAWLYLRDIRTRGLYSNRALLAYAWSALQQEMLTTALPALQMLNRRSIALAEVQEGAVLIGHVYEQQGASTRALRSYVAAEDRFVDALDELDEIREFVEQEGLSQSFIQDLSAASDPSQWEGVLSTGLYRRLAPYLVDLMASQAFQRVFDDLDELYAIRNNLAEWREKGKQHRLVLEDTARKTFDSSMRQVLAEKATLHRRLDNQRQELRLLMLTLTTRDQERFAAVMENASRELAIVDDQVRNLRRRSAPYRQPPGYEQMVADTHRNVEERQRETERYIARLEPVLGRLVNAELSKHEERIRYYLAQTRLAKARLYDTALSELEAPASAAPGQQSSGATE